jgi:hypothetical protein
MKTRVFLFSLAAAIAVTFSFVVPAQAQVQYKILLSFTQGGINGTYPSSKLTFDSAGNMYGVTEDGGDTKLGCTLYEGCGVVFKLSPTGNGGWHDTSLFRFSTSTTGALPVGGVVVTAAGGVIGTTLNGGSSGSCSGAVSGCGLVFQLAPATGIWPETVLQYMDTYSNGGIPDGLIADASGNLYGVNAVDGGGTCGGGGCGTIYRLSPSSSGGWEMTVLYAFTGGSDGGGPWGGLTFDAAGNLYGSTYAGGNLATGCNTSSGPGCGVVFKLSPTGSGPWDETVLYTFTGLADGGYPNSDLAFDSAGNLYGTTLGGGKSNSNCDFYGLCGVVFKLSPTVSGPWSESVLYSFSGGADGATPAAGVIVDSAGNLYGTTEYGGGNADCGSYGCGVVFKMAQVSGGAWKEVLLHTFDGGDGESPTEPLTFGSGDNLYGTASGIGGVVFEIKP